MFGALIRRHSNRGAAKTAGVASLDSTVFSLTTDVPRPTDRRADDRILALLPVGKLVADDWQDFCKIRSISAGGLMADTTSRHDANVQVIVELNSSQQIPGTIVWTRDTTLGIKFDQNVDLREILANRRPRIGYRPRPARLDINCTATVRIGGLYYKVEVRDISLGGIKIYLEDRECVGKEVVVTVESLRPVKGTIRWHDNNMAGVVFDRPLSFEELAEWLSKRIEVASLRAGTAAVSR